MLGTMIDGRQDHGVYFLPPSGVWSPEGVIVLRFSGAGVSDVGRVRPHNEDSGFVGPYVAVVADGVGGAAAGEIASATAAYAASAVALGRLGQRPEQVLAGRLRRGGRAASGLGVQRDLDRLGMATTLTMVVTDGRHVSLGHVGDSRGYLLHDGRAAPDHRRPHLRPAPRRHRPALARGARHAPVAQRGAALGRRRPRGRRPRRRPPRRRARRPAAAVQRRAHRPRRRRPDRAGHGRRGARRRRPRP